MKRSGSAVRCRHLWGPTSPLTVQQLQEMDDEELIAYLEGWVPSRQWGSPSVEGLARTFSTIAEQSPLRASALVNRLRDARPAYVQSGLQGLEQAARRGDPLTWASIIDLMDWVANQPREHPGGRGDEYDDADPGWVWTRRAVASPEAGAEYARRRLDRVRRASGVWRIISHRHRSRPDARGRGAVRRCEHGPCDSRAEHHEAAGAASCDRICRLGVQRGHIRPLRRVTRPDDASLRRPLRWQGFWRLTLMHERTPVRSRSWSHRPALLEPLRD